MKTLKAIVFCSSCALVFLLAAALSCLLRAKYSLVPKLKTDFAYRYAANLEQYSFLQYNQAGPEQGRQALLEYLTLLQRIRNEKIQYPQNTLHRDFGLTYLRLNRLALAGGNSAVADDYMKSAQKEWLALGWKEEDVSAPALTNLIETRELNEKKLFNGSAIQVSAPQESKTNRK